MNVIVICLDTFRADLVGKGGALSAVATPALDQLATQSVVFERAFGEAQPTLQARRSFFTGMRCFPWRFNVDRRGHWHHAAGWHKIPPEHDTIAEILCSRGYYTGLVTDTHHMFKPTMNFTRGFCSWDFIRGQVDDHWRGGTPAMVADLMKRHVRQPIDWPRHVTLLQYLLNNRHRRTDEDYLPARVMDTAAQWLDENHECRPFFLWVDGFDPHEPWDPPKAYADRYMPGYDGIDFIWPGIAWERGEPSNAEKERIKALYCGEAAFVDHCIARLLDTIDALRLWDDTVVIFTADHGTQIFDNGDVGKSPRDLRAYNTRIPLFIRHPGGPRGAVARGFVQAHDLMPTSLGFLGIPVQADGVDIWPMVAKGAPPVRDHAVIGWSDWANGRARGYASIRDDEWNYIIGTGFEDKQPRLYHLTEDPEEKVNVVDRFPNVVARQRRRVEAVMKQPLPGVHEEMCAHPVTSHASICRAHWFKGHAGPPVPEE